MYGAQTSKTAQSRSIAFENDVEMYGAQTPLPDGLICVAFENDVEMYGAQTSTYNLHVFICLRMMQKCMVLKRS